MSLCGVLVNLRDLLLEHGVPDEGCAKWILCVSGDLTLESEAEYWVHFAPPYSEPNLYPESEKWLRTQRKKKEGSKNSSIDVVTPSNTKTSQTYRGKISMWEKDKRRYEKQVAAVKNKVCHTTALREAIFDILPNANLKRIGDDVFAAIEQILSNPPVGDGWFARQEAVAETFPLQQ